ncbi:uncharacterized protein [Miscanthus floridulus]|uniref:uncharacterized protein n=1 Tax=Miscanthus floridulus TaxID=154761 RepID=UPI003459D7ED
MKTPVTLDSAPLKAFMKTSATSAAASSRGKSKRKTPESFLLPKKPRTKKARLPPKPQVEIPTLGNTSAPAEPTPEVSTEDEEIHDSEISETHEAEGSRAYKPDETIDEILDELARETSPDQAPNLSPLNLQPSSPASHGITHPDDQPAQQKNITKPTTSYSFSIEDYVIEKGEEITSHQTLSLENQAQLKEVIILLNKDTISLVQDADQIKDLLELIDQDIPSALKAPLESAAHLDDHFAMAKGDMNNIGYSQSRIRSSD